MDKIVITGNDSLANAVKVYEAELLLQRKLPEHPHSVRGRLRAYQMKRADPGSQDNLAKEIARYNYGVEHWRPTQNDAPEDSRLDACLNSFKV